MNIETVKRILGQKEPARLYELVEPALADTQVRRMLVENSFEKNETVRYNSVRVLFRAMDREPQLFYPYWQDFAGRITSPNGFHRAAAAQAIAFLTPVDTECLLDRLLKPYLALITDSSVMVSHYFIETLDRIYRARPDLQARILKTLLGIDQTSHPLARRELLKADIIGIFDKLFDLLEPAARKRAIRFATSCLESSSGKTRKAAKAFVDAHSNWQGNQ